MPLPKAPALQQVGQFPLYSKVKCQCTNGSLEATLQPQPKTCTHTQSKAADTSPFPQISTTEYACAPFPAWGWEGIVRFKERWRIYLFLHIWCWGIMVKGRIPISSCAGHRQHYCWKCVLSHTPMQIHTVFGNRESPTACSLTNFRSLRGSFKSSILGMALKAESRASPCCGAGNVCAPTEC